MINNTNIRVPKKYHHMIDEIDHDNDGYWVYSKKGYKFLGMDSHTAHEDTQAEIIEKIEFELVSCKCRECLL